MIRESTKKWQTKVKELENHLREIRSTYNRTMEENIALKAKLERFEQAELSVDRQMVDEHRQFQSENQFLRGLLEKLIIPPENVKAFTTREIRFAEMQNADRRRERKEMARQEKIMLEHLKKRGIKQE